jgi:hypothetical protein
MLQHPKAKKITLKRIATPRHRELQLRDTDCGKSLLLRFLQATEKVLLLLSYQLREKSLLLFLGKPCDKIIVSARGFRGCPKVKPKVKGRCFLD